MHLIRICLYLLLVFPFTGYAQIGGLNSHEYTEIPANARVTGLGSEIVSIYDGDVNLLQENPAALNSKMFRTASLSYLNFFADIYGFSGAYAHEFGSFPLGFSVQYFDLGVIKEADATGQVLGESSADAYTIGLTTSQKVGNYSLGISAKFLGNEISGYNSHAVAADLGGMFIHPERDWQIGMVIKNAGFVLDSYSTVEDANLPFDVLVGTSYKLENMPLRLNITAHHLHKWDITYLDRERTKTIDLEGNVQYEEKSFADNLARHFIVGGEFVLGENVLLWFSYNYQRRKELRLVERSGGAGFSFGAMVKVNAFSISYAKAMYHIAGGTNNITISADLNRFIKRN